ncbi:hypothetical protein N9S30_00160 [bacterium]|nr:hypothetical protein [bacterium]
MPHSRHAQQLNILETDILVLILTMVRRSSPFSAMRFAGTCRLLRALGKDTPLRILKLSMYRAAIVLAHVEPITSNRFKTSNLTYCSQRSTSMEVDTFFAAVNEVGSRGTRNDRLWYKYDCGEWIATAVCRILFYSPRLNAIPQFSLKENDTVLHYHPSERPKSATLGCVCRFRDHLHAGVRNRPLHVVGTMSFDNDMVRISFTVDLSYHRSIPRGPRDNNEFDDDIAFSNAQIVSMVLKKPTPIATTT